MVRASVSAIVDGTVCHAILFETKEITALARTSCHAAGHDWETPVGQSWLTMGSQRQEAPEAQGS